MNLEDVFKMQHELNARVHPAYFKALTIPKDSETFANIFNQYTTAQKQEESETLDTLNWKWWKKHKEVDILATKGELVDEFHFFVSRCLLVGMSADELLLLYYHKNKKNHERQDNGY